MPLVENSLAIDVPESVLQHPIIKKLHTAANDILCWGNVSSPYPSLSIFFQIKQSANM